MVGKRAGGVDSGMSAVVVWVCGCVGVWVVRLAGYRPVGGCAAAISGQVLFTFLRLFFRIQ